MKGIKDKKISSCLLNCRGSVLSFCKTKGAELKHSVKAW